MQRGGLFGGGKGDPDPLDVNADGEEVPFAVIRTRGLDDPLIQLKVDCTVTEMVEIYENSFEEQKDTHKFNFRINDQAVDLRESIDMMLSALGHV